MSDWKVNRFWKNVSAAPEGAGFGILLDTRPVRTPAKAPLVVPTQALAQEIAAEWDGVTDRIDPDKMPLTRMANSAIDKVEAQKSEVADLVAAYGDSDLLCYRADNPDSLVQRQNDAWDPLLDWASDHLNARLIPRVGVVHSPQDPGAIGRLTQRVHGLSNFELAAFHDLVSLSGSLIIGFAAIHRFRTVDALWDDSRIDENWQIEQWGADDIATKAEEFRQEAFFVSEKFFCLATEKT